MFRNFIVFERFARPKTKRLSLLDIQVFAFEQAG
jgi:hypothetical protein